MFARFGITQDLHIAQISHQSGKGEEMTESLIFKVETLLKHWSAQGKITVRQAFCQT